jgi:hypothetical protein
MPPCLIFAGTCPCETPLPALPKIIIVAGLDKWSSLHSSEIKFYRTGPFFTSYALLAASVIKLFTVVIYVLTMVIPSFCVIKQNYLINYSGMAVDYRGKKFYNISPWWQT